MKTSDFDFTLPEELIAQWPSERREDSRLMVVDPRDESIRHQRISDLPTLVEPGTVVIVNDTKVRHARLLGTTAGGGKIELLLIERVDAQTWRAMTSRARRRRSGLSISLPDGLAGEIIGRDEELSLVRFDREIDDAWLDRFGHVPLPPYIKREDAPLDAERYQTVFARASGSVASPTAGLHLTEGLLAAMKERGALIAPVTLHVGLGTFLPIRTKEVEEHQMHEERYSVGEKSAELLNAALADKRPVLAVGTTSVRTVESAWREGRVIAGSGTTRLYIYPGFRFSVVSSLLTNFHTPGSSLILLVSAFGGRELLRHAYEVAVGERYRFFSYGDAMLIAGRAPKP